MREQRPWGYFEVLAETEDYKVKRLVVEPGQRLSLQLHRLRHETWTVVSGHLQARVGFGNIALNAKSNAFEVPAGTMHRINNPGPGILEIIEVQRGVCDEDDIERFEDDYGRVAEGVS